MRVFAAASAILIACLGVSGCTSSSSTETALTVPPASVKTARLHNSAGMAAPMPASSVPDIDPTPVAAIVPPAPVSDPHALAWNGRTSETHVFDGMATTVGMPVPSERPMAALRPAVEPSFSAEPAPRRGRAERLKIYGHRFGDAKPMNFGRVAPRHFAVHGVDVSRWQANIDWPTLRTQGANFAYIKATDGGDHFDPMFRTNWRGAKEAGIRRGAYHFFYWCRTAGEQADWFIRNVPRDPDALPPVIDVEYNHQSDCKMKLSTERVLEKMQVFMDKLEKYYGKRPVIYTAPDFYADHLQGQFRNYPFWLRSVAAHPAKIYPDRKWLFWQYSGSGLTQGVDGRIDLNVFNGSESGWHDWVERSGWAGSAVAER